MSFFTSYWREILILILGLIVLIEYIIIVKTSKMKKTELAPVVNEVRKELRNHQISQQGLFKEIDYLLQEIPGYIQNKVEGLTK